MRRWLRYYGGAVYAWLWKTPRKALCLVVGHNYGQHLSVLVGGAFPKEHPWCDRCGEEAPR